MEGCDGIFGLASKRTELSGFSPRCQSLNKAKSGSLSRFSANQMTISELCDAASHAPECWPLPRWCRALCNETTTRRLSAAAKRFVEWIQLGKDRVKGLDIPRDGPGRETDPDRHAQGAKKAVRNRTASQAVRPLRAGQSAKAYALASLTRRSAIRARLPVRPRR